MEAITWNTATKVFTTERGQDILLSRPPGVVQLSLRRWANCQRAWATIEFDPGEARELANLLKEYANRQGGEDFVAEVEAEIADREKAAREPEGGIR